MRIWFCCRNADEIGSRADWDPDGYVESDSEDSGSDSDDYSAERGDRFDDGSLDGFNLAFYSGKDRSSSVRMRSFRSFDSLNLMEPLAAASGGSTKEEEEEEPVEEEPVDDSGAGSDPLDAVECQRLRGEERFDSGIGSDPSADRSSPEEEESASAGRDCAGRTGILRRSAEALSEDSGYGDASGSFPVILHSCTLIHFKVNPQSAIFLIFPTSCDFR